MFFEGANYTTIFVKKNGLCAAAITVGGTTFLSDIMAALLPPPFDRCSSWMHPLYGVVESDYSGI